MLHVLVSQQNLVLPTLLRSLWSDPFSSHIMILMLKIRAKRKRKKTGIQTIIRQGRQTVRVSYFFPQNRIKGKL